VISFLLFAGYLAGCNERFDKAEDAVRAKLRDPSSAQFRNVHFNKISTTDVCGEVNAKSLFGGYIGFNRFVAEQDGTTYRVMFEDASAPESARRFFATLWDGC
jgi:hypothetical protein